MNKLLQRKKHADKIAEVNEWMKIDLYETKSMIALNIVTECIVRFVKSQHKIP